MKKFKFNKGNVYIPLLFIEFIKFNNKAIIIYIRTYQKKIGLILYIAIIIKPDTTFVVLQFSYYFTNPFLDYIKIIDYYIQYLWNIRYYIIQYNNNQILQLFSFSNISFINN